jgi:hypothetical protein
LFGDYQKRRNSSKSSSNQTKKMAEYSGSIDLPFPIPQIPRLQQQNCTESKWKSIPKTRVLRISSLVLSPVVPVRTGERRQREGIFYRAHGFS